MRFGRTARPATAATLAAAVLIVAPALSAGQDTKRSPRPGDSRPGSAPGRSERASGVIIKVEQVAKGATPGSTIQKERQNGRERPVSLRLTINTNAVWRDWARDQSRAKDSGPAKKDARRGANSVATEGEPADRNSMVVIDLGPETRVDTRFRSPEDETGKGAATPEGVAGGRQKGRPRASSAKPVRFRAEDLKPGLFVEADFRHVTAQNPATVVTVIRPIGGPEAPTPAEAAAGSERPK